MMCVWSGVKATPLKKLLLPSRVVLRIQVLVFQRSTPPVTATARSDPSAEKVMLHQPSLASTFTGVSVCPSNDQTLTLLPAFPSAETNVLPSGEKATESISAEYEDELQ